MEPISGLQHHDVILILLGHDSALKDIEDAIQSTSGPLEPSQKRGTSVNEDPRVCLPLLAFRGDVFGKFVSALDKQSLLTLPRVSWVLY